MVQEYLNSLPEDLRDLDLPLAADRPQWDALPEAVRAALVRRGVEYRDFPWPALTCTDWLVFFRTGERTAFEDKYFSRRRAVCALALAECVRHDGQFLEPLTNGIWAICEESAWQLPPHNNYIRDTAPLPLPDVDRPVPDLFACETAATLSLIRGLLGPELEQAAPGLPGRIQTEIDRRVVQPYLRHHFWWMGNGDEPMCNWTAWCTQNVLLAVFTSGYPQGVKRTAVKQAAYSLDCFLKDYGQDGCCEEGALYYRHAGLTLWGALEVMDRASGGCFAPLFQTEKIRNIANYIVSVHVDKDYYLNYADCSPAPGPCGAREFLFARRTGSAALQSLAALDTARRPLRDLPDEISLFARLLDAFLSRELLAPRASVPPSDCFYPSTGLWIARDSRWCISVRAGHNGGSHGHCDAGSLIVYREGSPLLIDLGPESYNSRTFSAERPSIWTVRSDWHNLPAVNGAVQGYGSSFGASWVEREYSPERTSISMELASAYPPQAEPFSYRRTVLLERNRRLTVQDRYQGAGTALLSLLLCEKPVWRDGVLAAGPGGIRLSRGGEPSIEAVHISDPHLRQSWPDTLYRVLIPVSGTLTMEFL